MTPGRVFEYLKLQNIVTKVFDFRKISKIHKKKIVNPQHFIIDFFKEPVERLSNN